MINSISTSQSTYLNTNTSSSNSLSLQQQELIDFVLSNYEASSLTSQDTQDITQAFSEAGIQPTKQLAQTMQSLGFDTKEIGSLAGANRPPMPLFSPKNELNDTLLSLFANDEDDESTTSISFEDIMDYTSKILNLNESAKTNVLNMFESYASTSEDNELSKKDTKKVVSNSVIQIISDENNYSKTSF